MVRKQKGGGTLGSALRKNHNKDTIKKSEYIKVTAFDLGAQSRKRARSREPGQTQVHQCRGARKRGRLPVQRGAEAAEVQRKRAVTF